MVVVGAGDPRCKVAILMGKTDASAKVHAAAVDDPDAAGCRRRDGRAAPHRSTAMTMRRTATWRSSSITSACPPSNLLLGEGRGFEIAQGRLGPGRIHHCMRTIGAAEEALEAMVQAAAQSASPSARRSAEHSIWEQRVAEARIDIDMTRLLCLKAADLMDKAGNKAAKAEIAMIKVKAPRMALKIIDDAVQAHGGAGVSQDSPLAASWAGIRTLRLADGPDEVHNRAIARMEFAKHVPA